MLKIEDIYLVLLKFWLQLPPPTPKKICFPSQLLFGAYVIVPRLKYQRDMLRDLKFNVIC